MMNLSSELELLKSLAKSIKLLDEHISKVIQSGDIDNLPDLQHAVNEQRAEYNKRVSKFTHNLITLNYQ